MKVNLPFLFVMVAILLCTVTQAQNKFLAHDFVDGNIPIYKPAFQEDFPNWAKMLL